MVSRGRKGDEDSLLKIPRRRGRKPKSSVHVHQCRNRKEAIRVQIFAPRNGAKQFCPVVHNLNMLLSQKGVQSLLLWVEIKCCVFWENL